MSNINAILLTFHVGPDAGYAIDSLLSTFLRMARRLVVDNHDIHVAFPNLNGLKECVAVADIGNIVEFDSSTHDRRQLAMIEDYIRVHDIDVVFGFDQPVQQVSCRYMRRAGARRIGIRNSLSA